MEKHARLSGSSFEVYHYQRWFMWGFAFHDQQDTWKQPKKQGSAMEAWISRLQLCNSHFEVKHIFRFGCLIFWFVGYVVHCWRGESDENAEYWRISFCETKTLSMNGTKPRYKTHNAKSEDDELRWIRFTKWCEVTQKNESLEVESIWEQIICSHSEMNAIFEWKTK